MRFKQGQPRPAKAGRRKGTPNKATTEIGQFFRSILDSPDWQRKVEEYFLSAPVAKIPKHILELAYHYGFGRPTETMKVEDGEGCTFTLKIDGNDARASPHYFEKG